MMTTTTRHPLDLPKAACLMVKHPETGLYLATSRKKNSLLWGFPGGKVDPGESLLECLARETLEETGYNIKDKFVTMVYFGSAEGEFCTYVYSLKYEDLGPKGESKEPLIKVEWKTKDDLCVGPFGAYNRRMFTAIGGENTLDLVG